MSFEQLEQSATKVFSGKFITGLICALIIAAGLFYGYSRLRLKQSSENKLLESKNLPVIPPPQVEVYANEARLKGKDALISGTVVNTSTKQLNNLSIILELGLRNQSQLKEKQTVSIQPSTLNPGQQTTYQLLAPWNKFSAVRIISINSGQNIVCQPGLQQCLKPGTTRPKETTPDRLPAIKNKTPMVPRPRKANSNEIINTPETADPY